MSQPKSKGTDNERPQLTLDIDTDEEEIALERVPVDMIRVPEASGPDSRLRKSLEKLPFFTSVTLRSLGPETMEEEGVAYEVVAGERRVKRAKESGIERVPAMILPKEAKSYAPIIALAENIARDPNPLREALEIYTLRENGHSEEDLVAYGIPAQRQKKALRLALAPDDIIEGVRSGDISVGAARKVGNMEAAMQRRCAEHYREAGELRHKDITRIRQEYRRAEAESLDTELFEEAPGAEELEEGPGGDGSVPEGPTVEHTDFDLDTNMDEVGETTSPLPAVRLAVEAAREEGFSEQAILRKVHDALQAHRD